MRWKTNSEGLRCRWAEVGKPYDASWMEEIATNSPRENDAPLAFTKLSPFGGSDWYCSQTN
jgi:hypothetical protein